MNTSFAQLASAPRLTQLARDRTSASVPEATTVVTSIGELKALRAGWTALRRDFGLTSPNADPDRFITTVRALGEGAQPYVAMFQLGGRPHAMIIGRAQTRTPRYRIGYFTLPSVALRCLDVVYGGLITDGSDSATQAVVAHLRRLLATRSFDHIMLNHLPVRDRLSGALFTAPDLARRTISNEPKAHWRLTLVPHSYDATIRHFSRKHRYNMRRADRLLVEHFDGDVVLRRFGQPQEIEEFAVGAADIAARTYQAALGAAFSDTKLQRDLLRLEAGHGRLRAYWLQCAGTPVAFQLGVVYGGTYHLLATAFLPQHARLSPGQVLLVRVIRDLCQAGAQALDYGFGDARYKQIYGTHSWEEATVHLYSTTVRASSARLLDHLSCAVTRCTSRLAARCGLMGRIKKRWRARLSQRCGLNGEAAATR